MQERRKGSRTRALKTAKIVFNNRYSAMDCTVRNLSREGAMLLVAGPYGIPDRFSLELDDGSVAQQCKVVWREERRIGVAFA